MVTIYSLTPGASIRILKTFKDCAGEEFEEGTILHYVDRNFVPYHAGHTIYFKEANMYLCDNDDTCAIVQNSGGAYFALTE